jgi:hypothetical protein
MIEQPITIIKWRDAVTSAKDLWSATDAAITTDDPHTHKGTLFEPEAAAYQMSDVVCQAIAAFLSAREWTPEAQRSRGVPRFTVKDFRTRCIDLRSWRGFRTDGDKGFLCWRTLRSGKELERRDSSWMHVSLFEFWSAM